MRGDPVGLSRQRRHREDLGCRVPIRRPIGLWALVGGQLPEILFLRH